MIKRRFDNEGHFHHKLLDGEPSAQENRYDRRALQDSEVAFDAKIEQWFRQYMQDLDEADDQADMEEERSQRPPKAREIDPVTQKEIRPLTFDEFIAEIAKQKTLRAGGAKGKKPKTRRGISSSPETRTASSSDNMGIRLLSKISSVLSLPEPSPSEAVTVEFDKLGTYFVPIDAQNLRDILQEEVGALRKTLRFIPLERILFNLYYPPADTRIKPKDRKDATAYWESSHNLKKKIAQQFELREREKCPKEVVNFVYKALLYELIQNSGRTVAEPYYPDEEETQTHALLEEHFPPEIAEQLYREANAFIDWMEGETGKKNYSEPLFQEKLEVEAQRMMDRVREVYEKHYGKISDEHLIEVYLALMQDINQQRHGS